MTFHLMRLFVSSVLISCALLIFGSCSDEVQVVIKGPHSVMVGKSTNLTASTEDGADASYIWASEDPSLAKVDAMGKVTGVKLGETFITATGSDTGAVGRHPIVVSTQSTATVEISGQMMVLVGKAYQFTATTKDGTDSSYFWSSENVEVAKVDESGNVTGVKEGATTITATGNDSGATGSLAIMVTTQDYWDKWASSGHADATSFAFNFWKTEDPPEIPTYCAKCHGTPGFLDYLGADGSTAFKVDKAHEPGAVITCEACHNPKTAKLDSAAFPSGVNLDGLNDDARCMTCHQGIASKSVADKDLETAGFTGPADIDKPLPKLFWNGPHYFAAGAVLNAGRVGHGYEYPGMDPYPDYDHRFRHVPGWETCTGCHDPHSLKVKVSECKSCHPEVTGEADLKKIRVISSKVSDYDGDGDKSEGIHAEIEGLSALLLKAILAYPKAKSTDPICYEKTMYPYWFKDTNGNGKCDLDPTDPYTKGETAFPGNAYASWTARLYRAAFNYQVAVKDPGAYAHNAKYVIQLVHDSIKDLNTALGAAKVDISKADRDDTGHFNGASLAFRLFNTETPKVIASECSRCHAGSKGFLAYLDNGQGLTVREMSNGLDCATCHTTFGKTWETVKIDDVTYPSGVKFTLKGKVSNLCSTCHSGTEAKLHVDKHIALKDYGSPYFIFAEPHGGAAAAVKKGSDAKVGYEYTSKTYAKTFTHTAGDDCTYCHDSKLSNHSFRCSDSFSKCTGCHQGMTKPEEIRMGIHALDYDGDGKATEPLADEIATLRDALLAEMKKVATTSGKKICFHPYIYPFFFNDKNGNGTCDLPQKPDPCKDLTDPLAEACFGNNYVGWTPALMKAAFNYYFAFSERGAWAHNFNYMVQLLIDSIADLGGDVTTYKRP